MTVTAKAPSSAGFLNLDTRTLALIVGAVFVFLLLRGRR